MNNLSKFERIDDLHIKNYKIIQHTKMFCFGIDAVLLSDFARAKKGARVLDLGTGNGIIPILMEAKQKGASFVGLELQEESASLAKRSVKMNGQEDKIEIMVGDIKEAGRLLLPSSFQVITCNPPYMNDINGLINKNMALSIARHELKCTLEDVISQAARLLEPMGSFYMIHKPFRVAEIIGKLMEYKLEPKRIRFVHPYVDSEPTMVLIEAVRGGKSMIKVEPPLIIYQSPNVYTDEIYDIYGYDKESR